MVGDPIDPFPITPTPGGSQAKAPIVRAKSRVLHIITGIQSIRRCDRHQGDLRRRIDAIESSHHRYHLDELLIGGPESGR